jgi:hypothetical protein
LPRGQTAVTPVRTACLPSPEIRVVWPTPMLGTSVIAFSGPGVPSNEIQPPPTLWIRGCTCRRRRPR